MTKTKKRPEFINLPGLGLLALSGARPLIGILLGLLAGAGSWIRPPHWYRALTAQWLPARFREEFALDFGAADQRAAERTRRWLPGIYRRLPSPVRYAGSWLEATARLDHRRAGPLIRASNRFWIGEPVLPFCG